MPHDRKLPGPAPTTLCLLFAAALAACGGGGGSASTTASATAAAGADTAVASAAGASAAASASTDGTVATAADAGSTPDASDGSDASATGALSVKTTVLMVPLAAEGQTFRVAGTMAVRFGTATSWVTQNVTDSGTCSAAFFGAAATSSAARSCQVQVSVATGSGAPVATVGLPSNEGDSFFTFGKVSVQFGANGKYLYKDVTGRGDCTNAAFGSDPIPGVVKNCTLAPSGAGTLAVVSQMPRIDPTKIPADAPGFATPRVMAANVADPGQNPAPSDIGDFREYCDFSHMSYADPIAAPGGSSAHLHTFLGNSGTDANSTASSIAMTGNSTCAGGTLNRTAYWVPTLIDTTDATPQKPAGALMYYKQGYNYIASTAIRSLPAGLRIVAGSAASTTPQDNATFNCFKTDGTFTTGKSIPTDCPAGATLAVVVAFPQCWDGVNLDSPDHKSHMAYPGVGCPATHPVALPNITFNVYYLVGPKGTSRWRLSSDNYDSGLPGGYSSHADWFNGWNPDTLNTWMTRCINASMDCHAYLIGDGRILY